MFYMGALDQDFLYLFIALTLYTKNEHVLHFLAQKGSFIIYQTVTRNPGHMQEFPFKFITQS